MGVGFKGGFGFHPYGCLFLDDPVWVKELVDVFEFVEFGVWEIEFNLLF